MKNGDETEVLARGSVNLVGTAIGIIDTVTPAFSVYPEEQEGEEDPELAKPSLHDVRLWGGRAAVAREVY